MTIVIDEQDLGKSRLELLTDLIFESEGIRIPLNKITYSNPETLDQTPLTLTDPNTLIKFNTKSDYDDRHTRKFSGALMYRRRELNQHFLSVVNPIPIYIDTAIFTIHEILPQINEELKYPLSIEDVSDQTYDATDLTEIVLVSNKNSLIWIGNVKVNVNISATNKTDILTNTLLDGFTQFA